MSSMAGMLILQGTYTHFLCIIFLSNNTKQGLKTMNRREATKNFYWTMWAWMSEQDEIKTKVLSNLMLRVVYHACVSYHANAIGFASI